VNAAAPILTPRTFVMGRPLGSTGARLLEFGICGWRHRVCVSVVWSSGGRRA
jgi:hypothetical protein